MTDRGKPLKRRYREFGLVLGGILLAIGLAPIIKSHGPRYWAIAAACAVFLAAAAHPEFLRLPYRAMLKFGHVMGRINAKVILTLFYYIVLMPVALILRIMGKRPIGTGYLPDADSYWVKKDMPAEPRSMERMF